MVSQPAAFMSYVRFVDQHEGGQITEFRERLTSIPGAVIELRCRSGQESRMEPLTRPLCGFVR